MEFSLHLVLAGTNLIEYQTNHCCSEEKEKFSNFTIEMLMKFHTGKSGNPTSTLKFSLIGCISQYPFLRAFELQKHKFREFCFDF